MRPLLCITCSALTLVLGVAASFVQCMNHDLAERMDDTQRRIELTRMWIRDAEATILAGESMRELPTTEEVAEEPTLTPLMAEAFQ